MASEYVLSLLDPFNTTYPQPKLYDGSVTRSAGVRFRNVGSVTLDGTGADTYFVLFPGFSYCLNWKTAAGAPSMPTINPNHLGTLVDRQNVRQVRLVSSGLKLSLENTSDDNEGSWEAVRIPYCADDFEFTDATIPTSEDFGLKVKSTFAMPDMANHATFQTGRLKDIHRFLFKMNSVKPDHDFNDVNGSSGIADPTWVGTGGFSNLVEIGKQQLVDLAFDLVVIKVKGRVDATVPSVLRYDLVCNQEVVYKDGTALGRIMTSNTMIPSIGTWLDQTRFLLPAIQVA